jgi:RND family efflux transporter MFP subunit
MMHTPDYPFLERAARRAVRDVRWPLRLAVTGAALLALAVAGALLFVPPGMAGTPEQAVVRSTAAVVKPALTITIASAQRADWASTLDASGAIAAWQEAVVGAQTGGLRLIDLRVNVGDVVKRGQLLARFDADMLRAEEAGLKASLAQAQSTAVQAETNRERARRLAGGGGISDQDVLLRVTEADTARAQVVSVQAQLDAKRLQLRYADVLAPDDGVISARSATVGAVASSGQELFRLIRQNRLEWRGELTAVQMAQVVVGQRIALALPDGRSTQAQVRALAPSFDAQSRLGLVYADIEAGGPARVGMYASGHIVVSQRAALVVPASSVVVRDGRSYVFILKGEDAVAQVVAQAVTVGRRQGGELEIVQGLNQADRVAVQGAGFLNDGDTVRIAASTPAVAAPAPVARAPRT